MIDTWPLLEALSFPAIRRDKLTTLQVNLGYLCNQQCLHCHVNAGPNRKENMTADVITSLKQFIENNNLELLDLTGGAPELNPEFRELVVFARQAGLRVMDRCNLTVLKEPGMESMALFLADNNVELTASLPCYSQDNVDSQRGKGVFDTSIEVLQELNKLGYGQAGTGLILNLVYNPQNDSLPPAQLMLEQDYKKQLHDQFGIEFNSLFTLANMPIKRFGSTLVSKGKFDIYMNLLKDSHQNDNLGSVMCRSMVSVDWQGYLYDCDFNQMLELPLDLGESSRIHISELNAVQLENNPIRVAGHCYGCTAGQGSSCGGAL